MSNPSTPIRAVALAGLQQQTHSPAQQQLRAGEQAVQYKGAMIRTSLAMVKPGGMASAMLAKLKTRPRPPKASEDGTRVGRSEVARSSARTEESDAGAVDHDPAFASHGGRRVERIHDQSGRDRPGREEDDESAEGSDGTHDRPGPARGRGVRMRVRRVTRAGAGGGRSVGASVGERVGVLSSLRAPWADSAMAQGGLIELRRALVDRLLSAARASDLKGWRRDWIGPVAAAYAARYACAGPLSFARPPQLPSTRELFIQCSLKVPATHVLPHRARETMYCLMWPVIHGLECPRSATQVLAMMVRLAVLARSTNGHSLP